MAHMTHHNRLRKLRRKSQGAESKLSHFIDRLASHCPIKLTNTSDFTVEMACIRGDVILQNRTALDYNDVLKEKNVQREFFDRIIIKQNGKTVKTICIVYGDVCKPPQFIGGEVLIVPERDIKFFEISNYDDYDGSIKTFDMPKRNGTLAFAISESTPQTLWHLKCKTSEGQTNRLKMA